MKIRPFIFVAVIFGLSGCSSIYYGTMEKLGVHKREIMVDRVKAARDTQNEAKEQFLTAMEQYKRGRPTSQPPIIDLIEFSVSTFS